MIKGIYIITIMFITIFIICNNASADFRITGSFQYEDRTFDISGCTGIVNLPIREADVFVYDTKGTEDTSDDEVIGQARTNRNGTIVELNGEPEVVISANTPINIRVCAVTSTHNTDDLDIEVRDSDHQSALYGVYSQVYNNQPPNLNLDIGTVTAPAIDGNLQAQSIGAAFNLFDCSINGLDYIKEIEGLRQRPSTPLIINYGQNIGWAYFNRISINMNKNFGYTDTTLYHEMGHWVQDYFSRDSSPGGGHSLRDQEQDPRLSFGEGWPTYWSSTVMQYMGPNCYLDPTIKVNLNGAVGTGPNTLGYSFEIEEGRMFNRWTGSLGAPLVISGASSELVVSKVLWDIVDDETINDITPDNDDDNLAIDPLNSWETFRALANLTNGEYITIEDFWDTWFGTGNNHLQEMEGLFRNHGMDYYEDAFEHDDTQNTARQTDSGFSEEHTLYNDEDWFVIDTDINREYYITTQTLKYGTDTYIEAYDNQGNLIRSNDNAGRNLYSYIRIIPNYTGPYYVKITHSPRGYLKYGNYKLLLEGGPRNPFIDDGILTVSAPGGGGEFTSIRRAIWEVQDGNTILFIDSSTFNEQIQIINLQNIAIKAADGCHPVINGSNLSGPLVSIDNAQDIRIEGLTIEGSPDGYGINIGNYPQEIIIENCIIRNNNWAGISFWGGVRYIQDHIYLSRIINNEIYNNSGPGIYLCGGKHLISENNIHNNYNGIFLYAWLRSYNSENQLHIINNRIYENMFGIHINTVRDNSSKIVNNIIAFNNSGIEIGSIGVDKHLRMELINNTISQNIKGIQLQNSNRDIQRLHLYAYNCIMSDRAFPGELLNSFQYSLFSDPMFVRLGSIFGESDFHLRAGSTCIDAGTDNVDNPLTPEIEQLHPLDIEGRLRIVDGDLDGVSQPDIGAYEYRNPNNPPQILLSEDYFKISENEILSFSVPASDPEGNPLSFRLENTPDGATIDPDTGQFNWHPNYDQAGTYSITIVVSDGLLGARKGITIHVLNKNRPPEISEILPKTVIEKETLTFVVEAKDPDGDPLVFRLEDAPPGAVIDPNTGVFNWTPGLLQAGNYVIKVFASDMELQDGREIIINVIPAKPNLVIKKVQIVQSNGRNGRRRRSIQITIANNGHRDLGPSEDFYIGYNYDWAKKRYRDKEYIYHNGIAKGNSIKLQANIPNNVYGPQKLYVDIDNQIDETNEQDNEYVI